MYMMCETEQEILPEHTDGKAFMSTLFRSVSHKSLRKTLDQYDVGLSQKLVLDVVESLMWFKLDKDGLINFVYLFLDFEYNYCFEKQEMV